MIIPAPVLTGLSHLSAYREFSQADEAPHHRRSGGAAADLLSFLLDSPTDGLIILTLAVAQMLQTVQTTAQVRRDGVERAIPVAGIPADCRLLEECDLSRNEAALTHMW